MYTSIYFKWGQFHHIYTQFFGLDEGNRTRGNIMTFCTCFVVCLSDCSCFDFVNSCMHARKYLCMHACMHVDMYAFMYAYMYRYMYACMHMYRFVCMHACMHVCMNMYSYTYVLCRHCELQIS